MTHFYIIRHGEKNLKGDNLTIRGRQQVKLLARRLKSLKITKIYSSDLGRCKVTTDLINKKLKVKIIYDEAIREISGKVKENPERHKKEIGKIRRLYQRLVKSNGNILIVGSGIFNRVLISMFLGISPKYSNFVQIPTGLTHIEEKEGRGFSVIYVNDTSHLPDKLKIRQQH